MRKQKGGVNKHRLLRELFKLPKVKFRPRLYRSFCSNKEGVRWLCSAAKRVDLNYLNYGRIASSDHRVADSGYKGKTCLYYNQSWPFSIWFKAFPRFLLFRTFWSGWGLLFHRWVFLQVQLTATKLYCFFESLCHCSKESL